MPVRVVDASAAGALLFGEPQSEKVAERLSNNRLVAPAILQFEVTSICLKKLKTYPESAEKILSAFMDFPSLSIQQAEVDHLEVIDLAYGLKLTTNDASYLWLAGKLNAGLVTLDKKLLQAAKIMNIR